jgi:DNA polymerase-3 subunit epsilon
MENLNISKPIIFFDLETTGLDISEDRIVQFAALKVFGDTTVEGKNFYLNPKIPIKKEASDVHHISDADVAECAEFGDVAGELCCWIGDSDLAGYNIMVFDLPLLVEEFGRAGIEFSINDKHIVDLYKIYRTLKPANLESVYREYVGGSFDAHDAAGDSMATYQIAIKLFSKESERVGTSVLDWEKFAFDRSKMVDFAGKFIRNDEGIICFNFGKDKGTPVKENIQFLKWMLDKQFTNDTKNWARKLMNS